MINVSGRPILDVVLKQGMLRDYFSTAWFGLARLCLIDEENMAVLKQLYQ